MTIYECDEDYRRDPALPPRRVAIRIEDGALRFVGPDGCVEIAQVHRGFLLEIGQALIYASYDLTPPNSETD